MIDSQFPSQSINFAFNYDCENLYVGGKHGLFLYNEYDSDQYWLSFDTFIFRQKEKTYRTSETILDYHNRYVNNDLWVASNKTMYFRIPKPDFTTGQYCLPFTEYLAVEIDYFTLENSIIAWEFKDESAKDYHNMYYICNREQHISKKQIAEICKYHFVFMSSKIIFSRQADYALFKLFYA